MKIRTMLSLKYNKVGELLAALAEYSAQIPPQIVDKVVEKVWKAVDRLK